MKYKLEKVLSVVLVLVMVATVFSTVVKNVSAEKNTENEIYLLNPDVAVSSEGIVHVVWHENLTGNYEIYYANNLTGVYKTELNTAIQKIQNLISSASDKKLKSELEKVFKELNKALANATANDYQHSFKHLQHAVERLDKKDLDCKEIITSIVNSVRDITKVNILYREFLNIPQNHTAKAWEKFYSGLEKLNEEKYDKAVNEFRKAFKEAYKIDDDCEDEECSEKTNVGIDLGEIVQLSHTPTDSITPTIVHLNGEISVAWLEVLENGTHVFYTRSNNGISWWYFDATALGTKYLLYRGIGDFLPTFPFIDKFISRDSLRLIIMILILIIIIIGCHFLYGKIADGTYAPISDPYLTEYSYTTIVVGGQTIHKPGICSGDGGEPAQQPDLYVSSISTSSDYLFKGQTTTITATVSNSGDAGASNVVVRFLDGTNQINGNQTIGDVPAGGSGTASVSWTPATAGSHTLTVKADPDNKIPENDENNNDGTKSANVLNSNGDEDGDWVSNYAEVYGHNRWVFSDPSRGYLFYRWPWHYSGSVSDLKVFTYKTDPFVADTDADGQNDYNDLIPLDYDMDGDGYINDPTIVMTTSSYYVQRLVTPVNNDQNLRRYSDGTLINDDDTDGDGVATSLDNDDDNDGMSDEYEGSHGVVINGWQHPKIFNARYAILIGGGGDGVTYLNYAAFENDLILMRDSLQIDYNYHPKNVYVFLWNAAGDSGIDGSATPINILDAFKMIGKNITKNDFFYFFVVAHGTTDDGGSFIVYTPSGVSTYPFSDVNTFMSWYIGENYARSVFVFATCHSGFAIDAITVSNSIVIAAAQSDEAAWCWGTGLGTDAGDHAEFLYNDKSEAPGFLRIDGTILAPKSLNDLYWAGYNAAQDDDVFGLDDESTPQRKETGCLSSNTYF